MGKFIALLLILLLVTAAVVIACLAIYNRKRRQLMPRRVVDGTRATETAEKHVAPQEPQPPVGGEAEPTVTEETPLTPVAETQLTGIHEADLPAMAERQSPAVVEAQSTKAQEAQPIAEEASWATVQETQETIPAETQPTIIAKEIQTSRVEEPQAIAVEEAQAIVAEETEPAVTERSQQQETVKVQPEGSGEAVAEVKKGKREPIKRGGKPRVRAQDLQKQQTRRIPTRRSNLEIVCWKRERQWVVAVEVPEELLEKPGLTVLQNGSLLQQDESEETCWRLKQVYGEVIVRWNENDSAREAKVGLGPDSYLLFKLSGQSLDRGRLVKFPSTGSYLVIVPENWERDEALSGLPPAMPEPVYFARYHAHFFDLEKRDNEKIAFRLPNGRRLVIESKAPRFELAGRQLGDASETMGPLFGEAPPRIRALDPQAWQEVGTIVIGEEGRGRGRWRIAFSPDLGQAEQDLPLEVADRRGGWCFLRFYDNNDDLIESIDFRFLSVLKNIIVRQPPPLPTGDGHKAVRVEFLHEPSCTVEPKAGSENIQVERQNDKTILSIPPDLACDESRWIVSSEAGSKVEVTINIERIWWAIGEENRLPSDWQDRPAVLSREDFNATSSRALWLQLPRCRWVDKVFVGFERSRARPYDVRVTEKTVVIPLREYGDCPEVEDQTQEYNLKLWVKDTEGILAALPVSHERVAAVPVQAMPSLTIESWSGSGRRKIAIAKAVMRRGSGEMKVNGRLVDDYFGQAPRKAKQFLERLLDLKEVREVLSHMEVNVTVQGSSPTTMRQAKAVAHAIARALMSYDRNLTPVLKQAGFGGAKVRSL